MKIAGATALVTGANRGFGRSLTAAAGKAAAWSMTSTLRAQLAPQDVRVAGLHVGAAWTPTWRRR